MIRSILTRLTNFLLHHNQPTIEQTGTGCCNRADYYGLLDLDGRALWHHKWMQESRMEIQGRPDVLVCYFCSTRVYDAGYDLEEDFR